MPQERQGHAFRVSFDSQRDIFVAINPSGARIEVDKCHNALVRKCEQQGMIYDGISDDTDDFPHRYYEKRPS